MKKFLEALDLLPVPAIYLFFFSVVVIAVYIWTRLDP